MRGLITDLLNERIDRFNDDCYFTLKQPFFAPVTRSYFSPISVLFSRVSYQFLKPPSNYPDAPFELNFSGSSAIIQQLSYSFDKSSLNNRPLTL